MMIIRMVEAAILFVPRIRLSKRTMSVERATGQRRTHLEGIDIHVQLPVMTASVTAAAHIHKESVPGKSMRR